MALMGYVMVAVRRIRIMGWQGSWMEIIGCYDELIMRSVLGGDASAEIWVSGRIDRVQATIIGE